MNLQIAKPNGKQFMRRFEAAIKRQDGLQRLLGGKRAVTTLIGSLLLAEEMKNINRVPAFQFFADVAEQILGILCVRLEWYRRATDNSLIDAHLSEFAFVW